MFHLTREQCLHSAHLQSKIASGDEIAYRTLVLLREGAEMATVPEIQPATDIKAAAKAAIDSLPDNVTWDDVLYRLYVHKSVEAGLRDIAEGKEMVNTKEVRARFGVK